jgi:dTDP-4-dehydrorhamnose reductase
MEEVEAVAVVVGRGLIGGAVRDRLKAAGRDVITVSRAAPPSSDHWQLDLATGQGRVDLVAGLNRVGPDCVVLTHGPSDVSWMESHETQAAAIHCGVAQAVVGGGWPTILVSTDNVFSGERGGMRPSDPIAPQNAYGRLKARAETTVLTGGGLTLRTSLVYGDAAPEYRLTYAQLCLAAASAGEHFSVPTDQSFTPIHINDVAQVIAALALAPERGNAIEHLSGPQELSRFDFARLAYAAVGAHPDLVEGCLRRGSIWASRPRYSSLASTDFGFLQPRVWPPATPAEGLRRMAASRGLAAAS